MTHSPSSAPPLTVSSAIQPVTAGLLAAAVGFAGAFAIVLQGLAGVGATPAEAASGLLVLCVGQGALAIVLGLRHRQPLSIAWSTPGAALLMGAGVPDGGFGVAVTAFLITGLLIVIAGLWRPLGRAVAAIPLSLASAMLAGILMELCLAPVHAVAQLPALALPIILAWVLAWCLVRRYAVVIAVLVASVIVTATTTIPADAFDLLRPKLIFIRPVFDLLPAIGIAIPLFIVTMASQNVPGVAVLRTSGYDTPVDEVFVSTGLGSVATAVFGGHALNLSAITAALCAGPEAGADPNRRYLASVAAGVAYLVLGPLAGFAAAFIAASPPLLIQAVAGLALLSSLAASLTTALERESHRLAALITFITAASGISFLGVGAAFWGLLAGALPLLLERGIDAMKRKAS
ncbi:benzoate/H(+) symporter BenE family transporter [Azospirillum halopraeferens]|uniref:benzoate/H(+) symporter BenE family transporter n=1 Tax=Azospirillum halopraeferens TaxID=34010 RepID=UPI0004055C90|nr:benzoate/H(+) symporter BenE family transporter [Azospirillum halopraeferens]